MVFGAVGDFFTDTVGGGASDLFGGIGDSLAGPFKAIGDFFNKIKCFFQNIGGKILSLIKLMFIELFALIFIRNDPMLTFTTGVVYVWSYLLNVAMKLAIYLLFGALLLAMEIVLLIFGKDVKRVVRQGWTLLLACNADPRDWYRRAGSAHASNATERMLFLCGRPCAEGYRPAYWGMGCRRMPPSVPYYCPAAGITKLYEKEGAGGVKRVRETHWNSEAVESYRGGCSAEQLSLMQGLLVDAVCWQANEFDQRVQGFCYEYGCTSRDRKPFRCVGLTGLDVGEQSAMQVFLHIATLFVAVAVGVWWINTSISRRRELYKLVFQKQNM